MPTLFAGLAPARRRLVLAVSALAAAALVALLAVLVMARSGGSPTSARTTPQDGAGPVLLVPGYGGATASLDLLAATLRAAGRDAQVFSLPGDGTGDLQAQARALAVAARATLRRTGSPTLDVVGYSAGGVVARLWVRDYGGAPLARRIVTLGSPQHGSDLAGLAGSLVPSACPVACQQLEPGSDLLIALNAGSEAPIGPTFVSIWTANDTVVLPPESAELTGALNIRLQSICAGQTPNPTQLPTNLVVEAIVRTELAAGPPTPLSATDCPRLSP